MHVYRGSRKVKVSRRVLREMGIPGGPDDQLPWKPGDEPDDQLPWKSGDDDDDEEEEEDHTRRNILIGMAVATVLLLLVGVWVKTRKK